MGPQVHGCARNEALLAGAFADLFSFSLAIEIVAALTAASGVVAKITVRGKRAVQVDG